ncbi:MAG: hypothetical protein V2A69_08645 [Pseudomonadota bacterium]
MGAQSTKTLKTLADKRGKRVFPLLWLILLLFWPVCVWGATETVRLPITLDYPFIRSLFVYQAYTQPGERAVPVEEAGGCNRIELWDPEVAPEGTLLKLRNHMKISLGVPFFGKCTKLLEWEGYLEVLQRIWLDEKGWRLRFETVDTRTYNLNREPVTIANTLWNSVKTHVLPYFDQLSIDLAPPVKELKNLVPLFFPPEDQQCIERWFDTIRLGQVRVDPDAVKMDILMEVETRPQPKEAVEEPSIQEIERLAKSWEDWDAYLVYQLQVLIGQPLTEDERRSLLESLLETRHGFVQALTERALGRDLVREQFIRTWQNLTPILRKYLVKQLSKSPLTYLAFFTASDALATLEKLGPTLGMDISRDGLVRLAKLLSEGGVEPVLDYSYAVNPNLRQLLGFGPPLDESGPAFDAQELELPPDSKEEVIPGEEWSWITFCFPLAFAAESGTVTLGEVEQWIPPAKDITPYLDQVRQVLEQAAAETLAKNHLEERYEPFFRHLSLATAWQESCWRQFVKANGKVRYLVSYNQSSVGLMQINERIWRGVYRPESLRWNIHYNALAGSEILDLYLQKYALKKMDSKNPLDFDTLARVVYAMYNGGPGQFQEFLKRNQTKSFYKSDELFWQKYSQVKDGQFDQLSSSLLGE